MNYLEFAESESKALQKTTWEEFSEKAEKLCSEFLTETRGTFDGDQDEDGYSYDWFYDLFTLTSFTPMDIYRTLDSGELLINLYDNSKVTQR